MIPKRWDIWIASVPYEDEAETKIRPVLVMDAEAQMVVVFKMTSHAPRDHFRNEYALQDWKGAGLVRETTVRAYRTIKLSGTAFKKKVGELQAIDVVEIMKIL